MNSQVTQSQLDAYWMPFTGNRQFKKDPRIIVAAEGCYFTGEDGRKIFDGLSGLWTCGLGTMLLPYPKQSLNRPRRSTTVRRFSLGTPRPSSLPSG